MENYKLFEIANDTPDYFYSHKYVTQGSMPHFHRNPELYCVFSGKVRVTVDGSIYDLERGDAVWIDGLKIHSYECTEAEISYTIMGTSYMQIFEALFPGQKIPCLLDRAPSNKLLFTFLEKISRQISDFTVLEKYACTYTILSILVKEYGTTEKITDTVSSKTSVSDIIQYIYNHYKQDISLASIAAHFHFHPQTLSNMLKKYIKTDLRNYINNLRIQEVLFLKTLPENRETTTLELAFRCGFNSTTTFYRAYNKHIASYPTLHNALT